MHVPSARGLVGRRRPWMMPAELLGVVKAPLGQGRLPGKVGLQAGPGRRDRGQAGGHLRRRNGKLETSKQLGSLRAQRRPAELVADVPPGETIMGGLWPGGSVGVRVRE